MRILHHLDSKLITLDIEFSKLCLQDCYYIVRVLIFVNDFWNHIHYGCLTLAAITDNIPTGSISLARKDDEGAVR